MRSKNAWGHLELLKPKGPTGDDEWLSLELLFQKNNLFVVIWVLIFFVVFKQIYLPIIMRIES